MTLTPKQERFVAEYMVDLNAEQAALRAGYSATTARRGVLLSDPRVQRAMAEGLKARADRTQINADWVLRRLAAMADADMADLCGPDGGLLTVDRWPEVWRRGLVAGVEFAEEVGQDGEAGATLRKVKLADRLKVLELIGRHVDVGAWRDKVDVNVTSTLADRLARARARGG